MSRENFSRPSYFAFVASGENFPDALAAGPLAALLEAPLLLVSRNGTLPANVAAELRRLEVEAIYVIGGEAAVSAQMEAQLRRIADTSRFGGANRYETAASASFIIGERGRTVFLATGANFPDALAAGAVAGRLQGTVMLTARDTLPASTAESLESLDPSRVIIVGGTSVVSNDVLNAVKRIVPNTTRVAGGNRFGTAAAISRVVAPPGTNEVFLATGANFPDALAGAAVAGMNNASLLLTTPGCVPAPTRVEIERLGDTAVTVLGGPSVVSDAAGRLAAC